MKNMGSFMRVSTVATQENRLYRYKTILEKIKVFDAYVSIYFFHNEIIFIGIYCLGFVQSI